MEDNNIFKNQDSEDIQPDIESNEAEDDLENELENKSDSIFNTGSITTNGKFLIHCLTIIGQVEGHYILPSQNKTTKYEHVIPALVAIEQSESIKGLIIMLNTVGGDVEAGLAIAELIAGMNKPTVSIVLGGGHSIGVPLAVSANRSFIVPSATMTIHPVRMSGLVLGVPQTLSYFDKMQERIIKFACRNSKMESDRMRNLMMNTGELVMDVGTVLEGEAAVKEGLIDQLGGLSDAIKYLNEEIERSLTDEEKKELNIDISKSIKPKNKGKSSKNKKMQYIKDNKKGNGNNNSKSVKK